MKTMRNFFWMMLVAMATAAFAGAPGTLNVTIEKGNHAKAVIFRADDLHNNWTYVSIKDINGQVWVSQSFWNKESFEMQFDLGLLDQGDYIWYVANKEGRSVGALNVDKTQVYLFAPRGVTFGQFNRFAAFHNPREGSLVARFEEMDDPMKVKLQAANLLGKPAELKLATRDGFVVFSKTYKDVAGFNFALNLKEQREGEYYIYLKTDKATVVQFVYLDKNGADLLEMVGLDKLKGEMVEPEPEIIGSIH